MPIKSKAELFALLTALDRNDENAEILMFELRQRLRATDTSKWEDPKAQSE